MPNWFTRSIVAHYPHHAKKEEVQRWGGCEHVVADPSLLYVINFENDSFGKDGHCICEECHKAAQHARDQESRVCEDCHQVFKFTEVVAWTPYDYYPPDGDQPIYVCMRCQSGETHRKRVTHDQNARRDEFGDDDIDCE